MPSTSRLGITRSSIGSVSADLSAAIAEQRRLSRGVARKSKLERCKLGRARLVEPVVDRSVRVEKKDAAPD
jgi:hypothetical protein